MEKKINTKAISAFFKRNLYYILTGVCIVIIATVITVAVVFANANQSGTTNTPVTEEPGDNNVVDEKPGEILPDVDDKPTIDEEEDFIFPVSGNYEIFREFSLTEPVYSAELGHYAVHTGIDIAGEENAAVVSALSGVVESISDRLHSDGYTVTIKSDDGITCVYSSLGSDLKVAVGDTVEQGQQIGVISTSYDNEHLDVAHLHFEVRVNGQLVNPAEYLVAQEK